MLLRRVAIPDGLLRWISLFSTKPRARVWNGKVFATRWQISQGTRQGCPLWPTLFVISLESLVSLLRLKGGDRGIAIHDSIHAAASYEDEALLFLRETEPSLVPLISPLMEFGDISSLKVNWDKFCSFPFREPRTFNESNYTGTSIFWELNTFEYLGVQYIIQTQMKGWNLDKCLSGIRRLMTFWAGLPLSPQDRMSIAKMIVLPRLLYCFMVLLLSLYIFIFWDLKSAMSGLIWAHKRQRLYWKGNAPKDAGERGP